MTSKKRRINFNDDNNQIIQDLIANESVDVFEKKELQKQLEEKNQEIEKLLQRVKDLECEKLQSQIIFSFKNKIIVDQYDLIRSQAYLLNLNNKKLETISKIIFN